MRKDERGNERETPQKRFYVGYPMVLNLDVLAPLQ